MTNKNTAISTPANVILLSDLDKHLLPGETMCFTGHRAKSLCGYEHKNYSPFVSHLTDLLYHHYYKSLGVRNFITGGAQGFDQLAFWAVEHMKRKYKITDVSNIVFGVQGQDSRWRKRGAFSQEEYQKMLRMADILVWVSGGSIKALFERNHIMCDHSQHLLALYQDISWPTARGGTAETLRYATEHKNNMKTVRRIPYTIENNILTAQPLCECEDAASFG